MSPLHPVLVHFPIALVTVAVAADVIGRIGQSATAKTLGFWCLVLAVPSAAGAVAAGVLDMYLADLAETTHGFVHLHRGTGLVLLAALTVLSVWRWRIWRRGPSADQVGRPYLFSAAAVFALLAFQGWFGGQLVYDLGAGVSAAGQGVVSPEEGEMSLAPFAAFTQPAHDHHEHVH